MNRFLVFLFVFLASCSKPKDTQPRQFAGLSASVASATEFTLDDYYQDDKRPGYTGTVDVSDVYAINGNPDADYCPAFNRVMDIARSRYLNPAIPAPPLRISFTTRYAYHFYCTLEINHPVELVGASVHTRSGSNRLLFHGVSGIRVNRFPDVATSINVGGLYAEGISVEYVGSNTENSDNHGIIINRPSIIKRVVVRNFPGHGIHVQGTINPEGNTNASLSQFEDFSVTSNGKSGFWLEGKDAQVIRVVGGNAVGNGVRHVETDGYGFYDESMLGVTYEVCHTRNNYIAGYRAAKYKGISPNKSTYINCYSEHSAEPQPSASSEGPALLDGNALVITSMADGGLTDARGGAAIFLTSQGRIIFRDTAEVAGKNGASVIFGDSTVKNPGDTTFRTAFMVESKAYANSGVDLQRYYFAHQPNPFTRAWGFSLGSPGSPLGFGFTDAKHLRSGMPVAPKGILIGNYVNKTVAENGVNDGPRRIGYHDARYENLLATSFPNALVGDVVLSSIVNKGTYSCLGWIYAFSSVGTALTAPKWHRYGCASIGDAIP